MKRLLSYIIPQTLYTISSKYNKDIQVAFDRGSKRLLVNGICESGEEVRKFWTYAIPTLGIDTLSKIKKILVLGVAGGTIISDFHKIFPNAAIIGVEIDSVMISVGKQYFGIDEIPNFHIICADAEKFVKRDHKIVFDLIVIDLYIARDIPSFVSRASFIRQVYALLNPKGSVFINYLKELDNPLDKKSLSHVLRDTFQTVRVADYQYNRFFLAIK